MSILINYLNIITGRVVAWLPKNFDSIAGAWLKGGQGGGLPCSFSKFKEKCPDFGKKCPN